jgi:glycerol-3-phosphate dehydrogenase
LPGASGLEPRGAPGVNAIIVRLCQGGLPERIAEHLAQTYGSRAPGFVERAAAIPHGLERIDPELPYVWMEVDIAVEEDLARTIDDVLTRRIPLGLRARGQGLHQLDAVADRLAKLLAWSPAERVRQVAAYQAIVAAGNRWRAS